MDLGLTGRPAAVAAGSRGLGRACAEALAAEGARVAICGRDEAALERAREEIAASSGAEVLAFPADVSTEEGATGFVRDAAEALGGLEIVVPNAGGPPPGPFDGLGDEDFQAAFELNFLSTVRMTREALPHMRRAGYGRVVIIGSLAMKQPIPDLMLSNAVRAGVAGWARTLANEVARDGVTVNVVLPDHVLTDRIRQLAERRAEGTGRTTDEQLEVMGEETPIGRLGRPRELGDLVAFLASERAAYLTGLFVPVDGGSYRGLF